MILNDFGKKDRFTFFFANNERGIVILKDLLEIIQRNHMVKLLQMQILIFKSKVTM